MSTVTVCGRAQARVQPDYAIVELVVSHVADTAASALKRVAAKSTSLAQLLERLEVPESDWTTGQVSLIEEREWTGDRNELVGLRASAGIEVRVNDLANLAHLLREATDVAGAFVHSTRWAVDPANPVRAQLLGEAARDARARAEAYASALGCKLGTIEGISELPFEAPSPFEPRGALAAKMADTPELAISPGGVDIGAEIYVRFDIQPGAARAWR
jgi:uncharacterized protein YggE